MSATTRAVLRLVCQDRPGIVADVSTHLFKLGANILDADQHLDTDHQVFFQRVEFTLPQSLDEVERASFKEALGRTCEGWRMRWSLAFADEPRRVAILVSKRGHCVLDLLGRHRAGELPAKIPFVLSNHADLGEEVARAGYRFVHEPVGDDRAAQEARILARLREEAIDLVVLARYMQILSPAFVDAWAERIINIHHSFLPAFTGANPYKQAHVRGVKLIGATSHYVTRELDEGPIIHQDVAHVSHRDGVGDLERKGRDLERVVLANAVRWHLEDRVIAYARKTVVFE